jgi:hypothetical protein
MREGVTGEQQNQQYVCLRHQRRCACWLHVFLKEIVILENPQGRV